MNAKLRKIGTAGIAAVLLALAAGSIYPRLEFGKPEPRSGSAVASSPGAVQVAKGPAELPAESGFVKMAETDRLELHLDRATGHFKVIDRRSGGVWHSYPNPAHWDQESQEGVWRTNLRAPLMFSYINLNEKRALPKESNFLEEQGSVKNTAAVPGGFRLTFDMPAKQLQVPVEVTLDGDSVVTRIVEAELREGDSSLLSLRLYPFFGAEHSVGQDGYLLIPDGSGAVIPFRQGGTNVKMSYQEPVYGEDFGYRIANAGSTREQISLPAYGIKSGARGFVAAIENGAEYAEIIASPAGVFSRYNWATPQHNYRSGFKQVTNEKQNRYFIQYDKSFRFRADRTVRYMLLAGEQTGYVGMASRYRDYLQEHTGLQRTVPSDDKLPMTVHLVGAEKEQGLVTDRYIKGTSTADAMKIVQRLYGLGIDNLTINYLGWQTGGLSAYGDPSEVDERLGGNSGMKQFVQYARTLDIPVYLHAEFSRSNTSRGGFNAGRHSQRQPGGSIMEGLVSTGYLLERADRSARFFKSLGVAGITFAGIGQYLNSDYNANYPASREQERIQQQEFIRRFKDAGLDARGFESSLYVLPYMSAVDKLDNDYSYDTFSAGAVPFMQIALHGLIPYAGKFANERGEFRKQFLRDLEYGANPSYIFTYEDGREFKFAYDLHLLNPNFKEWETAAVQEYQALNEALGDVQDAFIIDHRALALNVMQTTYEGGKRVVVNYGDTPYSDDGLLIQPLDYAVLKGG